MIVVASIYRTILLTLITCNFIMAALFLLWPNTLIRLNNILKKPIFASKAGTVLDKEIDIDGKIMNLRGLLGFISLLTAFVLIFIVTNFVS